MEVPGMAERGLEPGSSLAEIDLVGDSGGDHPLERSVNRGAANARIFPTDEVIQLVRRDMAFLAQEDGDDAIALGRALAADRAKPREIQRDLYSTENDWPQPQVDLAFGFLMVKPPPVTVSTKSTSAPPR